MRCRKLMFFLCQFYVYFIFYHNLLFVVMFTFFHHYRQCILVNRMFVVNPFIFCLHYYSSYADTQCL